MTYRTVLPKVFPYVIRINVRDAKLIVKHLMLAERTDVTQGSSFAITVDNWDGTWNLWMSAATYKFLREIDIIETNIFDEATTNWE